MITMERNVLTILRLESLSLDSVIVFNRCFGSSVFLENYFM